MTLHCACRLGVLDSLYQQRNEIAYAIGLIDEVPIAMCNSDYDFDERLKIDVKEDNSSLPLRFPQVQEINLYFKFTEITIIPGFQSISKISLCHFLIGEYIAPLNSIFHPPSSLA